jgi:integrase
MATTLKTKVTKAQVDRLAPGETIRDTELNGFGARCQQGAPSYFLQKKIQGRVRWFTIGPHGSPWTPETARKEAVRLLFSIANGTDPNSQKQEERARATTRDVVEVFMAIHGTKLKPRTREEYARLFKLHILPAFGTHKIGDLTKSDVARFHAKLAHAPSGANFALAVLSKLCTWCEEHGYRDENSNPCRRIQKYRQNKRERFLSLEELQRLGQVLGQAEADQNIGMFAALAIRLLILTGARLNEIMTLQWAHVDLQRAFLFLPDSKTGKKPLRLSAPAIALLELAPRVDGNPFVIVGFVEGSHLVNLQKPWRYVRDLAGLPDVRIHDLRHTFASMAAASGASLPMIGKLLGHSQPQTTARYAHLADDPIQKLNDDVGTAISNAMRGR